MPENIGVEIFDLLKELEEDREEENLADTIEEETLAGDDEYVLDKLPEESSARSLSVVTG